MSGVGTLRWEDQERIKERSEEGGGGGSLPNGKG